MAYEETLQYNLVLGFLFLCDANRCTETPGGVLLTSPLNASKGN